MEKRTPSGRTLGRGHSYNEECPAPDSRSCTAKGTLRSGSLPLLSGRLFRTSRTPAIPLQSRPGLSLDAEILQDLFHTHPRVPSSPTPRQGLGS